MSTKTTNSAVAYIGPAGAGFGFQLSGLEVHEASAADEALMTLRKLVSTNKYGIIFMDEGLAEAHREAIDKLNEVPLPAILLLPNPAQPRNVAAKQLEELMIKAIGSDILSS